MRRYAIAAAVVASLCVPAVARAQAVVAELQQSGGVSSDTAKAASTQLRFYGEPLRNLHFKVEGSFGERRGQKSDLLGTAYPYGGNADVMEAYAEYILPERSLLRSVKAGRYRTPFGISSASEHAYIGFNRPPLMRYDGYWGVANTYMEHGASVVVGWPRVSAEMSVGRPADVGTSIRRSGLDAVARIEGSSDSLIVGASFIHTTPWDPLGFGPSNYGGLDARWMRGGVQFRGEYLQGQSMTFAKTDSAYVDVIAHRPGMGPFTVLGRAEYLDYDVPVFRLLDYHAKRAQIGVRVRVWQGLSVSTGVMHHWGSLGVTKFMEGYTQHNRRNSADVSVTYAIRTRP